VTFPAVERQRSLIGTSTKLYCLLNNLPKDVISGSAPGESRTSNLAVTSTACYYYTTKPRNFPFSDHIFVIFRRPRPTP